MSSMSTPVSQLPPSAAPPSNARHDEDQIVADVLSELQNERRPAPQQHNSPPPQHHVANVQQYMLPAAPPPSGSQFYHPQQQDNELIFGVIKKDLAIRVAVASIAAFLIFYPESLSDIYSKIPTIGEHLNSNDKIVRTLLLAVLLYVLLLKLEI